MLLLSVPEKTSHRGQEKGMIQSLYHLFVSVLWIRIQIRRIRSFGPPGSGSEFVIICTDSSIIKRKKVKKNLISTVCDFFMTFYL